ncbi:MAG TPA: DUF3870 domain-containing protein [Dehalococcoidia bacterium]
MPNAAEPRRDGGGRTMLFAGHARLPQSVAPIQGCHVIYLEVAVEEEGRITQVGVVGAPPLAVDLLRGLLVGRTLSDGVDEVTEAIARNYVGVTQRALAAAVLSAYETYHAYARGREQGGA